MADLPVFQKNETSDGDACSTGGACGTSCGNGLEKIYPTTAIRYGAMRWIGEFNYRPGQVFACGGKVVISTERGVELGEQVSLTCGGCSNSITREQIKRYIDNSGPEFYRLKAGRIVREATAQDLLENEKLNETLMEDIDRASLLAAQLSLDMKIVTVEHLLGGERIVFYFCSEGRVDFRELVKELARHYQTRIQMVQVGPRDEARLVADYEICGRECCCKNFLKKLRPVNMKMAKLQKSTLDPTKVSGRCGRLRCCLRYEHEGYEVLEQKLPRISSWVETEFGVSQVVDRQILTQLVLVRGADGREITIPIEEIRAFNVEPPPPRDEQQDFRREPRRDDRRGEPGSRDERRPPRPERGTERTPQREPESRFEPAAPPIAPPRSDEPPAKATNDETPNALPGAEQMEGGADAPPDARGDNAGADGPNQGPGRRRHRRRRRFGRGPRGDGPAANGGPGPVGPS
jgi:cell fate regulator YaaT (PSP1 superfamily)